MKRICFELVYYIPDLSTRLLSLGVLLGQGYQVFGMKSAIQLRKDNQKVFTCWPACNGSNIYVLSCIMSKPDSIALSAQTMPTDYYTWHKCLGHPSDKVLKKIIKDIKIPQNKQPCEGCAKGKMTDISHPKSEKRSNKPFEKIHSDVVFMPTESYYHNKYFVTFIDDYTGFAFITCMKHKSEVTDITEEIINLLCVQYAAEIKEFQCDGGGEYTSEKFKYILKKNGIKVHYSTPHTPQQNGRAERFNRTI